MNRTPRGPAWSAAWGVVAVIFGGGAIPAWLEAMSPGNRFPAWPAWTLTIVAAIAVYMCFAALRGGQPTDQLISSEKSHHPVNVDLIPEQTDDHQLLLGLLNHGSADEFSAQITRIVDPMGRTIGPQHWMIPWLEDNSAEPKRIFVGQTRMLDFAHFDLTAVNAELSTGQDGAYHWWFSSVPAPIGAKYYNLRCQDDLEEQHFTLTLRIMSASSEKYLDQRLRIGLRGYALTCEVLSDQNA